MTEAATKLRHGEPFEVNLNELPDTPMNREGDEQRCQSIREAHKCGTKLPPIILSSDRWHHGQCNWGHCDYRNGHRILLDGRHRVAVARERGDTTILAVQVPKYWEPDEKHKPAQAMLGLNDYEVVRNPQLRALLAQFEVPPGMRE